MHQTRLHPLTGQPLQPIFVDQHGRTHWPILGGAPDGEQGAQQGQAGTSGQAGPAQQGQTGQQGAQGQQDAGFPANTAVSDMTAEQQVAYWRSHARKHEDRANARQDYDQVKAELDKLRTAHQSESEKALQAARDEGKSAAMAEVNHGAVSAILHASLKMRGYDDARVTSTLQYVDPSKFVTNGSVDTQAIGTYVESLAGPATGRTPDYGAGARGHTTKVTGRAAGLAEAERRGFVKPQQ